MENQHRMSSIARRARSELDQENSMHVLVDVIQRVRELRVRASENDLKMVAYLLHMAEIEATDMLADASADISLEKH